MRAHEVSQRLERNGYFIVIIGRRRNAEVRRLAKDLVCYEIVSSVPQVRAWPHMRLGIVCQTSMPQQLVEEILAHIQLVNQLAELYVVETARELDQYAP